MRLLTYTLCAFAGLTSFAYSQTAAVQPAYATNPKFVDALKDAKQLEKERRGVFAEDAYKKANKIAGGECLDCLQSMYKIEFAMGNLKDAVNTATAMVALAKVPADKGYYQYELGNALLQKAGSKPKPEQLDLAHAAFQEAIHDYPTMAAPYYADGQVLAHEGKMAEASDSFKKCLDHCKTTDPARLRAEHFAENPELSLHQMAPAFEVTALDGSKFNLDAMGGSVVLIDFWATWCGPCNAELPHMKKIAKEFTGQPLVIISVSWDADEAKWKAFIAKNEMTWLQYRDADHKLSNLFGINAIPHYFTIDSDGVLTAEMLGEGADVEGKLKKLIAKARSAQTPAKTVAAISSNTTATTGEVALAEGSR